MPDPAVFFSPIGLDTITALLKHHIPKVKYKLPSLPWDYKTPEQVKSHPGCPSATHLLQLVELRIWNQPWFEDPAILIEALNLANESFDQQSHELYYPEAYMICRKIDITRLVRALVTNILRARLRI